MAGIALIGSGIFAREEHLPAIRAAPTLTLKAIYSRRQAAAESLAKDVEGVEVYSDEQEGRDYDALLARDDIKGVVIALPILVQPDYIKKALAAGKHVLAEKPIAKDVAAAKELISYASSISGATLSIAENFRFLERYEYASAQVKSLGRLLGFRVRVQNFVKPGGKYFETAWRKKPEYQGGFLLDGGVHFVAATRMILEAAGATPIKTSAFSTQLQEHLPPVDSVDATVQLNTGVNGTVSFSFGTSFSGSEYAFACEKGTVTVAKDCVVVSKEGNEETKEFPWYSGVKAEIVAWGEALRENKPDPRQSAEEALKDLQMLEAMLQSGEKGGAPVELNLW